MTTESKAFERLPRDVIPKNYFISLKPDLKNWTFEGKEEIDIKVVNSVSTITMNSADIEVSSAKCQDQSAEVTYNKEEELIHFNFPTALSVADAKLSVNFTGILNDRLKGFYRSTYKTAEGEEKRIASTQFEPVDARRSFPCWDEPDRKATFDIELTVPKKMCALSNMPEISREDEGELVRVRFDKTPIMSTYLLAYIVGEFDYVEARDEDGVLIRVYTPVAKSEQGKFALDIAVKTLPFYHKYFDIAYPLPKMDLIAIPDFAAGAMENWGLVTYRETAVLIDPKLSSTAARQRVALVVGHELAHQWFGNLVTMEWWTHLWLNEGFASFIEYLCVDHCLPTFNIWTQFLEQDLFRAFDLDSLKTSHAIEVECGNPNEIDEIFDAISYCKGASVIRMLHGYLGHEAFKKGLQIYLKRHKFGNTKTEDLWTALEEASEEPVNRIMSTWTLQMGYPVVTVKEIADGKLTVEQTRFLADGSVDNSYQWIVPITLTTPDKPNDVLMRFLLDSQTKTVDISSIGSDSVIKLNVNTVGVYRVCYPTEILEKLMDNVGKFTALDRLGLVNDMFALARSGHISTADVLRQTLRLKGDTDFTVWCCVSSCLAEVGLLVASSENGEKLFDSYVQDLMEEIYRKLGWGAASGDIVEEDTNNQLLRPVVLGRLGLSGHSDVVSLAKERFTKHITDSEPDIPADLRAAVYATVLKHGSEADFQKMMDMHNETDLSEEKMRIARSLGRAPVEFIDRVLNFAMSSKVRIQDTVFVLGSCTGSVAGRERTWQFVKDNWPTLLEKFSGLFLLGRLVKSTCSNFVTENHAKDVENFFKENKAPSAERAVEQSVENVRVNSSQLSRDGDAILKFLKEKYDS